MKKFKSKKIKNFPVPEGNCSVLEAKKHATAKTFEPYSNIVVL
jgi:hypothetical protein